MPKSCCLRYDQSTAHLDFVKVLIFLEFSNAHFDLWQDAHCDFGKMHFYTQSIQEIVAPKPKSLCLRYDKSPAHLDFVKVVIFLKFSNAHCDL